jgi:hypothetical protein
MVQIKRHEIHNLLQSERVVPGAIQERNPELAPHIGAANPHVPHDTGQLDQLAPFEGHLSPETRAIEHAANASDAFEVSDRAVDGLQNPRVVSQYIAARPQGREIQAHRALVVVIDLDDLIMPKKPALLLEPPRELRVRQRNEEAHHGERNAGCVDAFDHGLSDAAGLVIESHHEPADDHDAGTINPVDALCQAPSRILLLLHENERIGVRTFDAHENHEEIRFTQHAQELGVIREIDRSFGREFEGIAAFLLPLLQ